MNTGKVRWLERIQKGDAGTFDHKQETHPTELFSHLKLGILGSLRRDSVTYVIYYQWSFHLLVNSHKWTHWSLGL